jgi:NitT/TauT family transport system permease protein
MRQLLIVMPVLAGWEALARLGLLNPVIIGSPSLVFAAAVKDGPAFLSAFGITAYEMLLAAAIACLGGVAVGAIVGASTRSSRVFSPVFSALIALPLIVLYPVVVAWTGIGPISKVIYSSTPPSPDSSPLRSRPCPASAPSIFAMRSLRERWGRRAGRSSPQVMLRLALPAVLSGLRVGLSLVIISVVQSEMLSSVAGLGFLISYHRSLFNVGQVYLGIMLVLLVAAAGNFAVSALERRFGRRPSLLQAAA